MTDPVLPDAGRPPHVVAIELARELASVPEFVPTVLLEAVAAVLEDTAGRTRADVRAHRGRRGNPARRREAEDDDELARRLAEEAAWRWSSASRHGEPDELDGLPALGPSQWAVVVANAPEWSGTVAELFMVAQATFPGEQPVDVGPWLRWTRRHRLTWQLCQAQDDAAAEDRAAAVMKHDAHRALLRAAESRREAMRATATAQRLRTLAGAHRQALQELDDDALAAYERAVDARIPPEEALLRARGGA